MLEDNITEFCAAESVAGSKLLLNIQGKRILIDMGLEYKLGEEDTPLPFDAKTIDYVILTHGHADHVGQILKLIRAGFTGKIYCTSPTVDITRTQLTQAVSSAFIHNKWAKGKRYKEGPNNGRLIDFKKIKYNFSDLNKAVRMFETFDGKLGFPLETPIKLGDDITACFYEAGHIPGASQVLISSKDKNILFAYDLGRTDYQISNHPVANLPILRFPHTNFPRVDYIIVEATYGNRIHQPLEQSLDMLIESIKDVHKRKGKLIIPSFSIMRTQMFWNIFYRLCKEEKIPTDFMLYSSSPSADQIGKIMLKYIPTYNEEAKKEFSNPIENPFKFNRLIRHKKMEETLDLLRREGPYGIIASSGMGDFGRIVTILRETIQDPKNLIVKNGYASPNSRMDLIGRGEKYIPFYDTVGKVPLNAQVTNIGGFSGHSDCKETIAHVQHINPTKGIYIKHGEKAACWALRNELINAGCQADKVHVMGKGIRYFLKETPN